MSNSAFILSNSGDIDITGGKIRIEKRPAYAAAIRLRNKFVQFFGDWFLDLNKGNAYFQWLFVKNPNLEVIRANFRAIILSVDPIVSTEVTAFDYDKATRKLTYIFTAECSDGSIISGTSDSAVFNVTPP